MILILFFGCVFALVAAGAVLGFSTALYVLRPRLFTEIITALGIKEASLIAKSVLGLSIAVISPLIAGISYAVSGSRWMVELFGMAGTWFWAWVAIAYVFGMLLGCILRNKPDEVVKSDTKQKKSSTPW